MRFADTVSTFRAGALATVRFAGGAFFADGWVASIIAAWSGGRAFAAVRWACPAGLFAITYAIVVAEARFSGRDGGLFFLWSFDPSARHDGPEESC